jgi:hypothetical protein
VQAPPTSLRATADRPRNLPQPQANPVTRVCSVLLFEEGVQIEGNIWEYMMFHTSLPSTYIVLPLSFSLSLYLSLPYSSSLCAQVHRTKPSGLTTPTTTMERLCVSKALPTKTPDIADPLADSLSLSLCLSVSFSLAHHLHTAKTFPKHVSIHVPNHARLLVR